jgi:hypothetical protein
LRFFKLLPSNITEVRPLVSEFCSLSAANPLDTQGKSKNNMDEKHRIFKMHDEELQMLMIHENYMLFAKHLSLKIGNDFYRNLSGESKVVSNGPEKLIILLILRALAEQPHYPNLYTG